MRGAVRDIFGESKLPGAEGKTSSALSGKLTRNHTIFLLILGIISLGVLDDLFVGFPPVLLILPLFL